jgi:5'-3' exonuclease
VVALDGPAPFAKLETQRQRRQTKAKGKGKRSGSLSTLMVTPGTTFMANMDAAISQWAARNGVATVFDPSGSPGEGEVKIFKIVRQEAAAAAEKLAREMIGTEGAARAEAQVPSLSTCSIDCFGFLVPPY